MGLIVSEINIFKVFFHYKSIETLVFFSFFFCFFLLYVPLNSYGHVKRVFKVFPTINLWELYVDMATRVPIQSAKNPTQPFPLPDDALYEIGSKSND